MGARTILFIRTDRLGETVLNLPAVAALDAAWPDATITLLVHPELGELVARARGVDRVLTYPAGPGPWWVQALRLRALLAPQRFDVAVISNPTKALHVGVWLAGIPRRVGYGSTGGGFLLTDEATLSPEAHESEHALNLFRAIGIHPQEYRPQLYISEAEKKAFDEKFHAWGAKNDGIYVGLQIDAGTPSKEWPKASIEKFMQVFVERFPDVTLVTDGTQEDKMDEIRSRVGVKFVNGVGRTTPRELSVLLNRLAFFIGPDSGPAHIAAALGIPTLFLYSGTNDRRRWRPLSEAAVVLRHEVPCSPCALKVCNVEGHPCMSGISPEEVLKAAEPLLERKIV